MDEILIRIIKATAIHLPARVMAELLCDLEEFRELVMSQAKQTDEAKDSEHVTFTDKN
jgi:hypothetical protein